MSRSTDTVRRTTTKAAFYALLVITALAFAVPLLWLFSSALKPNAEIYRWPLTFFPEQWSWSNFEDAWNAAPFDRFLFNSIITTAIGAAIKTFCACTTAYAFVFLRFPAKNVLFVILLTAIMIPGNVTIIVNYLTVSNLGWLNTYLGLIVPGLGSVFGTFLLRQHFLSLPHELLEAGEMDGAGHIRRLAQIVLPISRPVVITVAVIALIDEWNSFIWPLIVTNTASMRTLPIGIYFLKDQEGVGNWGVILAGTVLVLLPMLIVYLFAQRFIVGGLTQGAIKG